MKSFTKRSLAILIAVLMVFSVMAIGITSSSAAVAGDTLYLVPNANWKVSNARFAAYFFNNSTNKNTWTDAKAVEGEDGLYAVTIPDGEWINVIFCRMNPSTTSNDWNGKWNQTSDLDVPTDGTNCYTVAEGAWDNGNGTWSTYVPGEEMTTAPPTEYVPEVLLKGSFPGNEWNGVEMTLVDGYYTYTYELEADSYEFKLQKDGDWLGNAGTIKDMTEGEGWTMKSNESSNCTLKASGGTYTFKFNFDTNKLMVEATGLPETEPTQPTEAPEPTTVYFVNSGEWAEVCAHMWADGIGTTWPGVAAEKTELTDANGYEVYSVTFTEAYTNIIFNNNANGQQTSDEASAIQAGKYLNFADQTWYATLEEVPVVEETEPQPAVYTVVGSEELCGNSWDFADTNNDMTDNADGTYTKVYSDVPAGEYEFKVVENRNWDTSYGDNNENIKFTVYESATVTINFDANTKTVTYSIEGDVLPTEPESSEDTTPSETPDPTTVYFVNAEGWGETINAYAWITGGASNAQWPGAPITKTELTDPNGNAVYSYTFTEGYENIIFNDGANQTVDLKVIDGADKYYCADTWYASLDEIPVATESEPTEPVKSVYTVAGSETLCGSNWNAEDTNNDMTDNGDGTYTKVYSDVLAGEYEFKVVENRNWDTSYGDNNENIKFTVYESATVTINIDANTKTVTYSIEGDVLPTEPESSEDPTPVETKTVKVGVIEWITNYVPTVHYWNDTMSGDAELTATGETAQYAVGDDYWSNEAQNFTIYTAEIPVTATGMKTWNMTDNSGWAVEEVAPADDQIILVFEWDSAYHNVLATVGSQEPSEETTPSEEDTTPSEEDTTPSEEDTTPSETVKNGIVEENGGLYYYVDGVKTYAGLIMIDGYYYYVNSSCKVIAGTSYYISKTNLLLPEASYKFDETGKMINPPTVEPDDEIVEGTVKNGFVREGGVLYYYVDGVKTYAGLIKIGEDYYYVNSSCKVITGMTYYISKTNLLLPADSYKFDETGKMINPPAVEPDDEIEDGTVKDGFVREDGVLYYYVDGVKTYAGLIKIGEDYYYVNSSCKVICGMNYYISKTNGLMDCGSYKFAADGKMVK